MPLDMAYAILGLKPGASLDDVKRNYRNLASLFHPDKGGYAEAMRLLNQAYERITKLGGKA
jgi:curved DNA-binding protein CbpA